MDQFQNKDVIQAVLIADDYSDNFLPFSKKQSTSLIPIVNVPMLDYALESLNRSGIEEVFVYSSLFINDVRKHIKVGTEARCSWSINMKVQIIGAEGCRCFGDAIRDLDAKSLIRGHFILMGASTITNANLKQFLDQHKKTAKFDKGAALTVVYKEASSSIRSGDEIMLAMDIENNRLHFHQRLKINSKENKFEMPLEIFLINSKIQLHHNLVDPQIAICSPLLLSLFSDNFDFETRDDFVRGLLINEEILDSRIYVKILPQGEYACKVGNWLNYQTISNDIINRWAYPLVPDMGICCLSQNYLFLRNNIYKNHSANVVRVLLKENIVIQEKTTIDVGSVLSNTVIGRNCKIGKNCVLKNSFIFDNTVIEDNCHLEFCVIGQNVKIGKKSDLTNGVVVGDNVELLENSKFEKVLLQSDKTEEDENLKKISNKAFILDDAEEINGSDDEDDDYEPIKIGIPKMTKLPISYEESEYNSSSDDDESCPASPLPDDINIFMSEVIDSLARGFQEKSNPDFLILEINSSRYAYNMALEEVNYYVVKAIFNLPHIKNANSSNVLTVIDQVLTYLGPVVSNYIKTNESMMDCLKAVEECCQEDEVLQSKIVKLIHYLYDKEIVSEDVILQWHTELPEESEQLKTSLSKLVEWLNQSSEEETSADE